MCRSTDVVTSEECLVAAFTSARVPPPANAWSEIYADGNGWSGYEVELIDQFRDRKLGEREIQFDTLAAPFVEFTPLEEHAEKVRVAPRLRGSPLSDAVEMSTRDVET
jgi:hypothetical protein